MTSTVLACLLLTACADTDHQPPPAAGSPPATGSPGSASTVSSADAEFAALERRFGARLGVYALDVASGRAVAYRADERFAYASTYKALAAAAILSRTTGAELARPVPVPAILDPSPVTGKHAGGSIGLGDAAEAAVRFSDNTAGNILLHELGGPDGFRSALRALGDNTTVPVRDEPTLNKAEPGDERDTSTPRVLARDLQAYVLGDVLPAADRRLLVDWLSGNATGDTLIRAGVPRGWTVADKSGAAAYGTRNDVAVVWPAAGRPIVLAVLSRRDSAAADRDDALVAHAATAVTEALR
ncbi:beta-lactamase [Actinoplanes siamensis]|uniref:Beta-lactamase n=2 Tax=Actinoplanes siamensis TaxID=1223317 RepID=A0A919N4F3_9ACTN|nr:class A beta-lactamase [Actinoplanes siamensis]GIF04185.1 beta-lactamase [Actinoplanes siamensis]